MSNAGPARRFCLLVLATAVSAMPHLVLAKMYERPQSFALDDKSQDQVERKILPKVNTEALLAEDRARGKSPVPYRYAVASDVNFNLTNSGSWQAISGGRLWRLRIQAPEAKSLSLGITRFDMPEGAKLWIYDPARAHVEGPYTSRHRSRLGSLWTPIIDGDEIVVEVFVPEGIAQPDIEISKVNQAYRGFGKSGEKIGPTGGTEGACEIDVVCPQADPWSDQIRAVGFYTYQVGASSHVCTGTMLNNAALDRKPYFLTAHHCPIDSSNDTTIVLYWNFQSATCGTHGPGSLADTQVGGGTYRASHDASDFRLLELAAMPDPSFNVYYAGWDATGIAPASTVGIHQPRGDVKAISFSNSSPQGADWTGRPPDPGVPNPSGSHWRVDWTTGVTEGGSSGSCLFAAGTQRCIGQLSGGLSACGVPPPALHDYYGRISVSWTGGGARATRLKDWLDPSNTGTLGLAGMR